MLRHISDRCNLAKLSQMKLYYGINGGKEAILSKAGKRKLEEALIEVELGHTEEFDSVDAFIKDLIECN